MNEIYSTTDINLASVLVTLGFKLARLDDAGKRRVSFVFDRAAGIEESVAGYWDGSVAPSALGLLSSLRNLKSQVKSEANHAA